MPGTLFAENMLRDGEQRLLWPAGAPGAEGDEPTDIPAISIHLPEAAMATGTGIVVNPGGGYRILASDHEGLQVARWLNRRGIAAFVLRNRVGPKYSTEVSLLDGLRAIRLVRANAEAFGISPNRLGMLGFSAGGHLVTAIGTRYDQGLADSPDPVERVSSRPDFLVPVYAVTSGAKRGRKADEYFSTDELVTADTPPSLLVHSHEDSIVPADQSILFYRALAAHGVQSELHVFGYGDHGAGLGAGDPDFGQWPGLLLNWLRSGGWLTNKKRVAVQGRASLDGQALGLFWVTLIPLDGNAPTARVMANRSAAGRFEIDAEHGPVPGPHRAEIHHISDQYPHVATGVYSLDDAICYSLQVEVTAGQHLELAAAGGSGVVIT
ncbi:MAG: alpha/beta hydrolase [Pseudomonadales bacterium]|jgi:acetyl esterase/lipase|nr:alpha/beta hydrolase [Pseudomonadales bacterium]